MTLTDLLDDSGAQDAISYLKRSTTSEGHCSCCCVRKYEYITHVFVKFGYGGCDYYPLTSVTDTGTLKIGDDGWACGDLSEIDLSSFNLCEPMYHSHEFVSVTADSDSQFVSCEPSEDDIKLKKEEGKTVIDKRRFCLSESCIPQCGHTVSIEENIYLTVVLKFASDSNTYAAPCGEEDCGHGSHVGGSTSKVAAIRSDEVRYIPYGEPGSSGFLQAMIPVSVKCPEDLGLEGTYVLCEECLIWPNGPIYDCHVTSVSGSYTRVSFQETVWYNNFSCDNVNYARLDAFYRRTDCHSSSSSSSSSPCTPETCVVTAAVTTKVYLNLDYSKSKFIYEYKYPQAIELTPGSERTGKLKELDLTQMFDDFIVTKQTVACGCDDGCSIASKQASGGKIPEREITVRSSCITDCCDEGYEGVQVTEEIYITAIIPVDFTEYFNQSACSYPYELCPTYTDARNLSSTDIMSSGNGGELRMDLPSEHRSCTGSGTVEHYLEVTFADGTVVRTEDPKIISDDILWVELNDLTKLKSLDITLNRQWKCTETVDIQGFAIGVVKEAGELSNSGDYKYTLSSEVRCLTKVSGWVEAYLSDSHLRCDVTGSLLSWNSEIHYKGDGSTTVIKRKFEDVYISYGQDVSADVFLADATEEGPSIKGDVLVYFMIDSAEPVDIT